MSLLNVFVLQISQARLEDSKKSVEIEALKREKEMLEHQVYNNGIENQCNSNKIDDKS